MKTHTLAPWTSPGREKIEFNGMRLILAPDNVSEIAYVVFDEDANLIAAAPDLLADSKLLCDRLEEHYGGVYAISADIFNLYSRLKASIAKAEGR